MIPAGTLDDDPKLTPDVHTFIEHQAPWFEITDRLPRFTEPSWVYSAIVSWAQEGNDARHAYEYFIKTYPDSEHVTEAKGRVAELHARESN